jgi:histone H3/H4
MAVIVKSGVRELVKREDVRVSDEFLKRLDADVVALINRACERARASGRKTLKARDL